MMDDAMSLGTNGHRRDVGGAFNSKETFNAGTFGTIYGGVTMATLRPGAVLFRQGEKTDGLFYVQAGQIRITVLSSQGKSGILGILDSGDFCGEGSLLGNRLRLATATCLTESIVMRLERANVIRAIHEDPVVAEFFLVFALTSAARLHENLISQLFDGCERRLARVLLALTHRGKVFPDARDCVIRNVDQEALAQMIGTTRSRVNHFMNKFRDLGWIDYDNNIIRVRPSLLDAMLDEESSDQGESQRRGEAPQ
jgi:CRP/FNR family transcriptional regulator, cyclic AMP receptor protein